MASITLSQSIAQSLAADIVARRLASGLRLDEVSIARRFKVSRTPVREALRQLVATRLIEFLPRRGFSVARIDRETLKDIFEGLGEIEALCAGLCAMRAGPTERAGLELIHERAIAAAHRRDPRAYAGVNEEFHHAIYAGARNVTLKNIALDVRQRLAPFRSDPFFRRDRVKSSLAEHEQIIRAILEHDAARATAAARFHTARTAINVMSYLGNGNGHAGPSTPAAPDSGRGRAERNGRQRRA
jgi:DNA-binding GntR family transcriptional regulator